jgi:hypothetical protein
LCAEVVAWRAGRPTRFLRDRSHRGAVDAAAADHPPDSLGELAAPLLVIDDLGHATFLAQMC